MAGVFVVIGVTLVACTCLVRRVRAVLVTVRVLLGTRVCVHVLMGERVERLVRCAMWVADVRRP